MIAKMVPMRLAAGLWLFLGLSSFAPVQAEGTYTEAQLKLAGQIGSVLSLVERCGSIPRPSAAILRVMKSEGLRETDLTRDTAFKARVVKQAQAMAAAGALVAKTGTPAEEQRKSACANLVEMYGTNGYVRAGLAASR